MASITGALILAAGKGTRMHSDKPKVLQSILGEPMLRFVYDALEPLFGDNVWTVIGHQADMVRASWCRNGNWAPGTPSRPPGTN